MKRGYCIDCEYITWIKAKNRCESHYRKLYYRLNRERELKREAEKRQKRRKAASTRRRVERMDATFYPSLNEALKSNTGQIESSEGDNIMEETRYEKEAKGHFDS